MIEIFVPIFLIASGFGFTKVKFDFDSDPRPFIVQDFEGTQRIFYNSDNLIAGSDLTTLQVINNLPNATTDFSPTGIPVVGDPLHTDSLNQVDLAVFSARNTGEEKPHRYGSFYF